MHLRLLRSACKRSIPSSLHLSSSCFLNRAALPLAQPHVTTLRPRALLLRRYNAQQQQYQGPHTTYFQEPPTVKPSRIRRVIFLILYGATALTVGAGAVVFALRIGFDLDVSDDMEETMGDVVNAGTSDIAARTVPPMTVEAATELIHSRSGYSVTPKAVGHTSQLASNMPIEDAWSSGAFTFFQDQSKDWYEWAVFDGHAGPRTAHLLKEHMPSIIGTALWEARCMDRAYTPNDEHIVSTIKKAFQTIDSDIVEASGKLIEGGGPLTDVVAAASAAFSGSCALLSLYDPAESILRVANVGDSRAVLGRWEGNNYVPKVMSIDQTGFNHDEVQRLRQEHPGEDNVTDPNTGRVHGIAVSRAFGDARWKWPQTLSQLAHDKFWGPSPRPDGMIKTPPYLTAEPEIMETRVHIGREHPDFLIMASDGLWDLMSNEDAVSAVQLWLEKHKPTNFLDKQDKPTSWQDYFRTQVSTRTPTYTSASDLADGDDTYFDEAEKVMKWRVSPKHFVVEDEHCGVHLIKNALGGKRRGLFTGLLTVQPPLSRNVRDDITVHVIFFGVDVKS